MSLHPALADEGASGIYVPGNFGFGAGVTPSPGVYISSGIGYYRGDIKVYTEGGKVVIDVDKRPFSTALAGLWVPETKFFGGQIGLSLASTYSYAWAHGVVTGLINEEKTVEGWGLGDTTPRVQIGWTSGYWSNTVYLTTWLPTGRYQRGFQPNTGKNRYGANIAWGVTYTEPETNLEFDSAIGVTFSTANPATDYKNGDAFIWDWAVGKRFSNGLQIGVAGYAYQQLTADTGLGAKLGPFEGRVFGIGPHLTYNTALMNQPVIFNFRYYREFDAKNRFEGDVATFGTTVKF
ncbi:MAG: transporter [Hyphomicrobium sp.]